MGRGAAALICAALLGAAEARTPACPEAPDCIALSEDGGRILLLHPSAPREITMPDLPPIDALTDPPIRAQMPPIHLADGTILLPIERRARDYYSGGGATIAELSLIEIPPDGTAREVLTVPIAGDILIRACFSPEDHHERGGICHDEYHFSARLSPDGARETPPDLTYRTQATRFPPYARRDMDNSLPPHPTGAEPETDPECSYSRLFRHDPDEGRYLPDAPLPDCSTFYGL